jgi:hypothetical protein
MRKTSSYIRRGLVLGVMLSGICTLSYAKGDRQGTLYIEKRDGETINLPITNGYPRLINEQEGEQLFIEKDETGDFITVVSADILRIYATLETAGIASRTADDDDLLPATVYAIDGKRVATDGKNLERLPQGVYIIKKGKKTTKFVRP